VNGKSVVGSTAAIFDTGTTSIVGDAAGIAAIFNSISGAQAVGDGSYTSASFSALISQHIFMYLQYPSPLLVQHPNLF
jgi:hypothetical protein